MGGCNGNCTAPFHNLNGSTVGGFGGGGAGGAATTSGFPGLAGEGGGGGSFVYEGAGNLLIAAGGGGGAADQRYGQAYFEGGGWGSGAVVTYPSLANGLTGMECGIEPTIGTPGHGGEGASSLIGGMGGAAGSQPAIPSHEYPAAPASEGEAGSGPFAAGTPGDGGAGGAGGGGAGGGGGGGYYGGGGGGAGCDAAGGTGGGGIGYVAPAAIEPISATGEGSANGNGWVMLRVLTPTTRISGKIITPFKDPEAGVKVRLAGTASAETTTAEDGTYSFAVTPGTYTVTPEPANLPAGADEFEPEQCPGSRGTSVVSEAKVPDCEGIVLANEEEKVVNFNAGYTVTGQVKGLEGQGVEGATVLLQDEEQHTLHKTEATTNGEGVFTARLAPGSVAGFVKPLAGVEFFPVPSTECKPSNTSCEVNLNEDRLIEFSACVVPNPEGGPLPATTPNPIPGAKTFGDLEAVGCWTPTNPNANGEATIFTSNKPVRLDGIDVKPSQGTTLQLDAAGPTVTSNGPAQLLIGGWPVTPALNISLNYQGGSTVSVGDQGAGTGPLAPNLFGLPISLGTGGSAGYGLPFSETAGQTTISGGLQIPLNTRATWDFTGGVFKEKLPNGEEQGTPSLGLGGSIIATNRLGLTGTVCGSLNDVKIEPFSADEWNDGEISGAQLCYLFEKGLWEGSGMFKLPTAIAHFAGDIYVKLAAQKAKPSDSGQLAGYKIQRFGLQFDHLKSETFGDASIGEVRASGYPIGLGFFLQSLGAEFSNDFETGNVSSITGTTGISYGPELGVKGKELTGTELSLLRGDLAFTLLPASKGLEYWTYKLGGALTIGRLSPLELQLASASIAYHANPDSPEADFTGKIGGSILGTGAEMKVNGQSDVPNGFLLEGTLTGKAFGQVGTLDAILNNYLLGVCLTYNGNAEFGFSEDLSKLDVAAKPGCNLGAFKHPKGASASASALARTAHLTISPGLTGTMLAVHGVGAPPSVRLTGGGPAITATPAAQPEAQDGALVFSDAGEDTTYIGLAHPHAGRWTITATPGSPAIAGILQADPQPSPRLSAKVTPARCIDQVRYRLQPASGEHELLYAQQGASHIYVGAPHPGAGTLQMKMLAGTAGTGTLMAYYLDGQTPTGVATIARFANAASNGSEIPARATLKAGTLRWQPACAAASYTISVTRSGKATTTTATKPQLELTGKGKATVTIAAVAATGQTLGRVRAVVG